MSAPAATPQLERKLGPFMLWGLGVGYVISGMYFGWNLGLEKGGTLGLAVATALVVVMYVCFTFTYTELACAIPRAGGAFDYAYRALGRDWGFVAGWAQVMEFVFAPPAIAAAIGAYFGLFFEVPPLVIPLSGSLYEVPWVAMVAYLMFTGLNVIGVRAAAVFELVITILAVAELLIFAGVTLPHFELGNLAHNALPNGISGIFAAIPFAIWFYLAIEGVANVAEETIDPQRNVLLGFGSAIATLVLLCMLTFASSVGVAGWEAIVFNPDGTASDSPLPLALAQVVTPTDPMFHLLVGIGLLGLVASFHGIILAGGRATLEFGRVGMAPRILGRVHSTFKTPAWALLANMAVGMVALLTGRTGEIITLACFGAVTLYMISMVSALQLRKKEPGLERPFRVPFFPWPAYVALAIAMICFVSLTWFNLVLAGIYLGMLGGSFLLYKSLIK